MIFLIQGKKPPFYVHELCFDKKKKTLDTCLKDNLSSQTDSLLGSSRDSITVM